jgi:hypothetical protein
MRLWTCICCGNVERLTFYPDACSSCGGAMTTEEDLSTVSNDVLPPTELEAHYAAQELAYDEDAAAEGDTAAVIRLWHRGRALTLAQRSVIDDVLHRNAVSMLFQLSRHPEAA